MGDELLEMQSALMDGELNETERTRSIDALLADSQLLARWRRDHVVRALLHGTGAAGGSLPASLSEGAGERLHSAIASEPSYSMTTEIVELPGDLPGNLPHNRPHNLPHNVVPLRRDAAASSNPVVAARGGRRTLLGIAAAAGIGVTAWVGLGGGLMSIKGDGSDASSQVVNQVARATRSQSNFVSAPLPGVVTVSYPVTEMSDADAQRARRYMFVHAQQAGMNGASQALPFTRVVAFERL